MCDAAFAKSTVMQQHLLNPYREQDKASFIDVVIIGSNSDAYMRQYQQMANFLSSLLVFLTSVLGVEACIYQLAGKWKGGAYSQFYCIILQMSGKKGYVSIYLCRPPVSMPQLWWLRGRLAWPSLLQRPSQLFCSRKRHSIDKKSAKKL